MALRIGTRGSALALVQARWVADLLGEAELIEASSDGEAGDKARFVRGVERALLEGRADVGVHSAKDLPAELPEGLAIAAVPPREDPADAWVGAGAEVPPTAGEASSPSKEDASPLDAVPEGARVGTSSLRRRAQLLAVRPDLQVEELHGNVDTRLRRIADGDLDAAVLALAGLKRLGREGEVAFALPTGDHASEIGHRIGGQIHSRPVLGAMTPAAGQGALVLQVRADDAEAREAVAALNDDVALAEVTAERAVVAALEADCTTPIGILARVDGGGERLAHVDGHRLALEAFVGLPDGSEWIRDRVEVEVESQGADTPDSSVTPTVDPTAAGTLLAERLLAAGAAEILRKAGVPK